MSGSVAIAAALGVRPANASDEPFLRELFVHSRGDLQLLPDGLREQLVDLQYPAQCAQYEGDHPLAQHLVLIDPAGAPVGRLVVDDSGDDLHLVDLTVMAEHRRRGIGTAAVGHALDLAAARGTRCTLAVWSANQPARALYERSGFVYLSAGDGYLHMAAAPTTRVLA